MKNILLVTAFKPSRRAAGENYTRQFIIDISRYCRVDLLYFENKPGQLFECRNTRVLRVFPDTLPRKLCNAAARPFLFPLFTVRFNRRRMKFLRKVLAENKYEVVIFDFSQTFLFSKHIAHESVVLNMHDVIYQKYTRVYHGLLSKWVKRTEAAMLKGNYKAIFSYSGKDRQIIKDNYRIRSLVNSSYLDTDVMEVQPEKADDYFVFFGNWKRRDNSTGLRSFLKKALPQLNKKIEIKIVGPSLPTDIEKTISTINNVVYLGFVDNPYRVLADAKALIAPILSGAGIKVKVLESFACGSPVIGFPLAFEGFSDKYDDYKIEVDNFDDMAAAINRHRVNIQEKRALKNLVMEAYTANPLAEYVKTLIFA
jgi:glycosyltransferase involved in cell wall biosynthesis